MKIKIWDILSILLLLLLLIIGGLILQVYRNPYSMVNPFPPPTAPAKLVIPSWTFTPQSMPATWTPTPNEFEAYKLASTSTFMPSPTYNILYPVIRPTRTFTKTTKPATNTPIYKTSTRTSTPGTATITNTPVNTNTTGPSPTPTNTGTATVTGTVTSTVTSTATATETPVPQPTAIAFSVDYNGDGYDDLVTMSSNGQYTNMIRAGSSGAEPILNDWSPDGNWLLFQIGTIPQVKKIAPDGTNESIINNMGFNTHDAVYSPDGNWILFVQGSGSSAEIWRMNSSGALAPERLTNDSYTDGYPDWSSDGHSIVFTSSRGGQTDLYLLDLNTGPSYVVTQLTNNSLSEYAPQFVSANQIVYMVNNGGQYDVYIADITNMSSAANLTATSAENEKYPAWAAGNKIIYIKQDGTQGVYTMNFDGSDKTRLNENYRYAANPRWVP